MLFEKANAERLEYRCSSSESLSFALCTLELLARVLCTWERSISTWLSHTIRVLTIISARAISNCFYIDVLWDDEEMIFLKRETWKFRQKFPHRSISTQRGTEADESIRKKTDKLQSQRYPQRQCFTIERGTHSARPHQLNVEQGKVLHRWNVASNGMQKWDSTVRW